MISHLTHGVWSWDRARLKHFRNKKTLADAALDGYLPDGIPESPKHCGAGLLAWKSRGQPLLEQIADIGTALLAGTVAELHRVIEDPRSTALQAWTANLVVHSMQKGAAGVYRAVLDRIAGKVAEPVQHNGPSGEPIELEMTTEERCARLAVIRARLAELEKRPAMTKTQVYSQHHP